MSKQPNEQKTFSIMVKKKKPDKFKKHNISRKSLANSDAYSVVPFEQWTFGR